MMFWQIIFFVFLEMGGQSQKKRVIWEVSPPKKARKVVSNIFITLICDEVSQFIKILRTIFGNFYLISTECNDVAVWYLN